MAYDFEVGKIDIDEYLRRTVFYRSRPFSRDAFIAAIQAQSAEIEGSLDLVRELAEEGVFLATLTTRVAS